MSEHKAIWSFSLDAECPHCHEFMDLLCEYPDLLEDVEICEQDTFGTKDFGVICPKCTHYWTVDFEY